MKKSVVAVIVFVWTLVFFGGYGVMTQFVAFGSSGQVYIWGSSRDWVVLYWHLNLQVQQEVLNSINTLSNRRYLIMSSAIQGLCLDNNEREGVLLTATYL